MNINFFRLIVCPFDNLNYKTSYPHLQLMLYHPI